MTLIHLKLYPRRRVKKAQYCLAPQPRRALGGQLKKRPGPARASASFSPGFHPGSAHTRDALINQYEIANHKSEIPFPPDHWPRRWSYLAPPHVGRIIFPTTLTSLRHSTFIVRYSIFFFPFFLCLSHSFVLFSVPAP